MLRDHRAEEPTRAGGQRPVATPLIVVDSVSMKYGSTSVLAQVSLTVERGASVAVVGPSGAGKSTLLHCLAGLVRPSGGTVDVGGMTISAFEEERLTRWRRVNVGLVFQQPMLLADLSVEENVALPLLLSGRRQRDAQPMARAALERVGLQRLAGRLPGEISGGEAQRTALARAVVAQPALLLCDEPTGSLDSDNAAVVAELLLGSAGEHGTTVVVVTHDNSLASRFDRIVRLRDGHVVGS